MTRYVIVDRTSAGRGGVASSRLLLGMDTDEADAVSAWRERVDDVAEQPNVSRRRIVLVCRGEVLEEWNSNETDSYTKKEPQ